MNSVQGRSEIKQREGREEQRERVIGGGGMLGMPRIALQENLPPSFILKLWLIPPGCTDAHPGEICVCASAYKRNWTQVIKKDGCGIK